MKIATHKDTGDWVLWLFPRFEKKNAFNNYIGVKAVHNDKMGIEISELDGPSQHSCNAHWVPHILLHQKNDLENPWIEGRSNVHNENLCFNLREMWRSVYMQMNHEWLDGGSSIHQLFNSLQPTALSNHRAFHGVIRCRGVRLAEERCEMVWKRCGWKSKRCMSAHGTCFPPVNIASFALDELLSPNLTNYWQEMAFPISYRHEHAIRIRKQYPQLWQCIMNWKIVRKSKKHQYVIFWTYKSYLAR